MCVYVCECLCFCYHLDNWCDDVLGQISQAFVADKFMVITSSHTMWLYHCTTFHM